MNQLRMKKTLINSAIENFINWKLGTFTVKLDDQQTDKDWAHSKYSFM